MSRHKTKNLHDAHRNARLAWLSSQIAQGKTDTQIILDCMAAFKCSEKIARENLKEIYERFTEIESDNLPLAKTKFMEMGMKSLEETRNLCQMGPYWQGFKILATMAGVVTDRAHVDQSVSTAPAPDDAIVRARIQELMKNKQVKEQAKEANIDLEDLKDKLVG